jgi:hypothetical protein
MSESTKKPESKEVKKEEEDKDKEKDTIIVALDDSDISILKTYVRPFIFLLYCVYMEILIWE